MKEKHYYLRTHRGKVPVGTVWLVKEDNLSSNDWARGISILSFRDALDLKEGKRHARASALKALGTKTTSKEVVRNDALDLLELVDTTPLKVGRRLFKSIYKPNLSRMEKKLLEEK